MDSLDGKRSATAGAEEADNLIDEVATPSWGSPAPIKVHSWGKLSLSDVVGANWGRQVTRAYLIKPSLGWALVRWFSSRGRISETLLLIVVIFDLVAGPRARWV
jgi:hypothetical protein